MARTMTTARLPPMRQGRPRSPRKTTSRPRSISPSRRRDTPKPRIIKRMEELGIGRPSTYDARPSRTLQDARLCEEGKEPPRAGGQGPPRHTAFLESVLRALCRIRLHGRSGRAARQGSPISEIDWKAPAARFLEGVFSHSLGEHRRICAPRRCSTASTICPGAAYLPAIGSDGTATRASVQTCGTGQLVAETGQIRRLHRLLQLSRLQVTPASLLEPDRRERRGRGRRNEGVGASIPATRARDRHAAQWPVRRICATRRGREAQARLAAQDVSRAADVTLEKALEAVVDAARSGASHPDTKEPICRGAWANTGLM